MESALEDSVGSDTMASAGSVVAMATVAELSGAVDDGGGVTVLEAAVSLNSVLLALFLLAVSDLFDFLLLVVVVEADVDELGAAGG